MAWVAEAAPCIRPRHRSWARGEREDGAVVGRVGVLVEQPQLALEAGPDGRRSRPSRAPPRRSEPRAAPRALDEQLAGAHDRLAVERHRRASSPRSRDGPGPGRCRRSPPRRRTRRGPSRGSSRPRAPRRSGSPSRSSRCRARRRSSPPRPCSVSSSMQPRACVAGGVGEVSGLDSAGRRAPRRSRSRRSSRRRRAVPLAVPSTGAMKPSPAGRFPKAPGSVSSPASGIAARPSSPSRRSLPFGHVIRASEAAVSASAIAWPLRRSASMSALITRASISSVTPGSVAIRTPRVARRLARGGVRERLDGRREHDVGRGHRGGDRIGRLGGVRGALRHHRQHRVGADPLRLGAQALAELLGRRVADHEHVLARLHTEAIADDRLHRSIQIAHTENLERPRIRVPHSPPETPIPAATIRPPPE